MPRSCSKFLRFVNCSHNFNEIPPHNINIMPWIELNTQIYFKNHKIIFKYWWIVLKVVNLSCECLRMKIFFWGVVPVLTENYCSGARLDDSSLPENSSFCVGSTKRCLTKLTVFSRSLLVVGILDPVKSSSSGATRPRVAIPGIIQTLLSFLVPFPSLPGRALASEVWLGTSSHRLKTARFVRQRFVEVTQKLEFSGNDESSSRVPLQ